MRVLFGIRLVPQGLLVRTSPHVCGRVRHKKTLAGKAHARTLEGLSVPSDLELDLAVPELRGAEDAWALQIASFKITTNFFDLACSDRRYDRLRPLSHSTTPICFIVVSDLDRGSLHAVPAFVHEARQQNPLVQTVVVLNQQSDRSGPDGNNGSHTGRDGDDNGVGDGSFTRCSGAVTSDEAAAFADAAGADFFIAANLLEDPLAMRLAYSCAALCYVQRDDAGNEFAAMMGLPVAVERRCAVQ